MLINLEVHERVDVLSIIKVVRTSNSNEENLLPYQGFGVRRQQRQLKKGYQLSARD